MTLYALYLALESALRGPRVPPTGVSPVTP
jgi:hypothetical protein